MSCSHLFHRNSGYKGIIYILSDSFAYICQKCVTWLSLDTRKVGKCVYFLAGYIIVPISIRSLILGEENQVNNGFSVLLSPKLFTCVILFNPYNNSVKYFTDE